MRYSEITEAKTVYDVRHPESDLKHWGNSPYHYIDPKQGFFFTYDAGVMLLHSEENSIYSAKVANIEAPFIFNKLSGLVDLDHKLITIAKEYYGENGSRQRNIVDIKMLQKALRDLIPYGVTADFTLKGIPKHIPKSVGLILKLTDPTDQVLTQKPMIMYHGTSMQRWMIIQRQGLRPGNADDVYNDLIPNYSNKNVYLATTEKGAAFYGKRQAKKDGDTRYVILAVTVPDMAKLTSDDRWVSRFDSTGRDLDASEIRRQAQSKRKLTMSGRELGEFGYHGIILPAHIKLARQGKL